MPRQWWPLQGQPPVLCGEASARRGASPRGVPQAGWPAVEKRSVSSGFMACVLHKASPGRLSLSLPALPLLPHSLFSSWQRDSKGTPSFAHEGPEVSSLPHRNQPQLINTSRAFSHTPECRCGTQCRCVYGLVNAGKPQLISRPAAAMPIEIFPGHSAPRAPVFCCS